MKNKIGRLTVAILISLVLIGSSSSSVFAIRTPDNHDATLTSQIPTTDDLAFNNAVCSLPSPPDLTTTYASYILDTTKYNPFFNSTATINAVKDSYQAAINDTANGTWFVSYGRNNNGEFIRVAWTRDPNAYLQWQSNPSGRYDHQVVDLISNGTGSGEVTIQCDSSHQFWGVKLASAGNANSNLTIQGHNFRTTALFYLYSSQSNFDYNYPTGYAGLPIQDNSTDSDGDVLTFAQETAQGTSDTDIDADDDGLDDYTESSWYPDREDVFCGILQCAYPNSLTKDIYVELDWMKDSFNNEYKPSLTQINLLEDMYEDKDINLHVDTGQFGGGNELAVYTQPLSYTAAPNQVDFWDYKNGGDGITANFSSDRSLIWRYMISGYNYTEAANSSGWAETMGDDLFISLGRIETMAGIVSFDRAVAGTMAHEIGHSLCLSDDKVFEEQPDECVYDGIDNDDENDSEYNLENYESVMNYRYQLTNQDDLGVIDYSDGNHGLGDHDDWGAVALGMGGFSGTRTALGAEELAGNYYVTPDGSVIVEEASIEEMSPQQVQNQGESSDDPLMNSSVKSSTDDSDKGLPIDGNESGSTLPGWSVLIVMSGVTAIITIIGVLLYLKKRSK